MFVKYPRSANDQEIKMRQQYPRQTHPQTQQPQPQQPQSHQPHPQQPQPQAQQPHSLQQLTTNGGRVGSMRRTTRVKSQVNVPEWSSKGSKLRQGLTGRRSRTRLVETEWIEQTFQRRECIKFVPDETEFYKCVCGKTRPEHTTVPAEVIRVIFPTEKWSVRGNTTTFPTDAYGTIEFQGAAHPTKAQYLRLANDTKPDKTLSLLLNQWGVDPPKLLISVHGGIANFELQPKLRRVCQQGLLKAAKTTGAWIVTGGTNTGVMKLVGDALGDSLLQSRDNIVTLGVAAWGIIHNRHELVGRDTITPYHAAAPASLKSQSVLLNCNHTYFLLVDDGTTGKFGSETIFRRKLEKHISQQKIQMRTEGEGYKTPVVVLLVEGGSNTIRTVLECVTDHPPVPVVVVDGSGRAADLIAFTHKYAFEGKMLESLQDQLLLKIERTFNCTTNMAEKIFVELMLCVKRKELITIHKVGEEMHDIDQAILAALLKGQNQSASDQLSLALTWNRVDIARSHIFTFGQDWQEGSLDQAMMDAIINDQVEFVKLLIENGVNMYEWLTIDRLEELYNLALCDKKSPSKGLFACTRPDLDRSSTLKHLMKEQCKKTVSANIRCTLPDIGQIVNKLMSGAYRSSYSRKKFRLLYDAVKNSGHSISNVVGVIPTISQVGLFNGFKYPYSDLMVWAVLLRRHRMARFFWESGEEALAKALIACKLNKSLAEEAEEDELEIDVANEIRKYAKEFAGLANELLDHCYKTNDDLAQLLLTYELSNWSDQTCLSLAVSANQKTFIANTCTQILLTEMWLGGLRNRKYSNFKVIAGIVFFPSIFFMEYRSWEELQMLPQTLEEHIQDLKESGESDSDDDVVSIDSLPTSPATTAPHHSKQIVIENVQATGSILESSEAEEMEKVIQSSISIQAFKTEKKHSQLRLRKKIYEFYSAPITKFWMHAISYGIFLVLFIYFMLVQLPDAPNWIEWYISMCMIGTAVEKIREFSISEPRKPKRKLKVFFEDLWNIFDSITLVLFFIGFIMRFETHLIDSARVFYSLTVALCVLRVMTFLAISSTLGPFVQIFGRMMIDLGVVCVFLLILLVAFGTFRLSIWYPYSPFQWHSVREIFLKPYFMLYGEEFADIIWPNCSDTDPTNEFKCTAGRWLVPVGQSLYILVGMYLLISLLMAKFNNTFNRIYTESNKVWKFQRYILVIEYQSRPILPAPLILLAHLVQLLKYILRKCSNQQKNYDTGLKLFLCDDDVERLHDFEEECMQIFCMEKENKICSTTDERIKSMMTQIENINIRIDDVYQREAYRQVCLQRLDAQLSKLCDLATRTAQSVCDRPRELAAKNAHSARDRQRELAARTTHSVSDRPRELGARTAQFVCDHPSGARSREAPTTSFETKQKPTRSDDRLTLGNSAGLRSYNEKKLGPFTAYSRTSSVGSMDRLEANVNKDADADMEASATPIHEPKSVPQTSCLKLKDNFVDFKMSSSSNDDSSFKSKFPSNNIEVDYMTSAKDTTFAENAASMSEYELPILQPIMFSAPERMEYSSIVNDIDTSCVDFQPSSPSTPHHSRLFDSDKHGRYRRRLPKRKSHGMLALTNYRLRRAEDTVHQKWEGIVHHRIRQISLTETESFSDLAKSALESLEDNEENEEDGKGMCNSLAEDTDLETSSSGSDDSKPETVPTLL